MTDFNLETECREARNRLHRSIGQLARQAKVRCYRNTQKAFEGVMFFANMRIFSLEQRLKRRF